MADEQTQTPPTYQPVLSPTHLKGIKEWLADPEENIHPMTRATYGYLLRNYGDGKTATPFAKSYDRYYAPFLAGMNAATNKDLIAPNYQSSSPFDSQSQIMHKRRYNQKLSGLSSIDPFLTAGAGGLGLLAAAGGGLGGLVAGHALRRGIPLAWHLAKQYFANKSAKRTNLQEHYEALRNKTNRF
jgi:hypothetical protein